MSNLKNEKLILDVPYYSQHLDVPDKYWQWRACGITCLKMAMDYYKKRDESLMELIKEGVEKGGYCEAGWVHEALLSLARDRRFEAFRKEYKSQDPKEQEKLVKLAIKEKIKSLKNKQPVIVSAVRKFSEEKNFHMVILTGFEKRGGKLLGFYYHDPDAFERSEGMHKFVPIETFKKYWRKMSIYIKE